MGLAVGSEVREWTVGKCIAFDDSFTHTAWHDGTGSSGDRVVLLVDVWHPELKGWQAKYNSIQIPDRKLRFAKMASATAGLDLRQSETADVTFASASSASSASASSSSTAAHLHSPPASSDSTIP